MPVLQPGRRAVTTDVAADLVEASGLEIRRSSRRILYDIDIAVADGEIVTVLGPNGAGKTTLLRALLGLIEPTRGAVRRRAGARFAYMPQRLAIDRTLPLSVRRFLAMAAPGGDGRIEQVAAETGITRVLDHAIQDVSSGEARRTALARALLRDPDILVLDEPSANLDFQSQEGVYRLIQRVRDRRGCAVVLVSHDLHLVMAATDRVFCLNGCVCCSGRPETVGRHPEFLALFGKHGAEAFGVSAPQRSVIASRRMFGKHEAEAFGVYPHAHDHTHEESDRR